MTPYERVVRLALQYQLYQTVRPFKPALILTPDQMRELLADPAIQSFKTQESGGQIKQLYGIRLIEEE